MVSRIRMIFVNRFFHPDASATSQILTELAKDLAREFTVAVVTSRQSASDGSARFKPSETLDGVSVVRLFTTHLGRTSLWRRAADYLSFHIAVVFFLLAHVARNDVVVLKTDPPLLQLCNTAVIRFKGGAVVNWLQDLYPEVAVRLAKFPGPRWLSDAIAAWRDRALRAARANVVVSTAMGNYLNRRGLSNVRVIPNWADECAITPVNHAENPLRAEWGLEGKIVVMYSGNFGRAHSFDEIAAAAVQLSGEPEIRFVFVGEGAGLGLLKEKLAAVQATNFVFLPFQEKTRLSYSLGAADLHLVTLKPGMEDLLMPSKIYGILAAGRPILLVGDGTGPLASWIRQENLGFAISSGDADGLINAIRQLSGDADLRAQQNINARGEFEAHYTRSLAVATWSVLVREVMGGMESRSTAGAQL